MIFIKYARKLNLNTVYYEYLDKFKTSIKGLENYYPIEIYMKNMEEFKFIRKVNKNYSEGLKLADELCSRYNNNFSTNIPNSDIEKEEIESEINASYLTMKGYFFYKTGKVKDAHDCFVKSVNLNPTDFRIWNDFAEMSENILNTIKGKKIEKTWFENTLINNFMVIVFKLDKAKYIIPKIFKTIKKFPNQIIGSNFDKYLENIPTWVWLFWIPQIFELLKTCLINSNNTFIFNILKKISSAYPQNIYYHLMFFLNSNLKETFNIKTNEENEIIKKSLEELKKIIIETEKRIESIKKIDIIMDEINKKMERNFDDIILNHLTNFLNFRNIKKLEEGIDRVKKYINQLKEISVNIRGEYIDKILGEFEELFKTRNFDIYDLSEKIKNWRYFINSKRATRTNFRDIHQILEKNLYNMNFEEVEIPGFFSNKIIEPTADNKVFISRFESEFNFKFINFANKKLIIRGSNEKLYSFKIVNEIFGKDNSDFKIAQMQVLLNYIFATNKDTYKCNIKFNLPIRFQITNLYKIIQEDTSYYHLDEVYDYCMQKMGNEPEISYKIYHEEFKKNNPNLICENLENPKIVKQVYKKMCEILPVYKLKNFIHKFIINCDEIFIFRKQFATSYALNNLMSNIFKVQNELSLDKISFNKETGSITFHGMKYFKPENFNLYFNNKNLVNNINPSNQNKKDMIPFRLSRNINVKIFILNKF